ncbi:TPA: terminase small subunit [Klebsiella oxytoca]|nr:terminase small subunit [Klebsiella oxytoca]TXX18677.1 hypothetical protein D4M54_05685 [Klebsiella pneumoniae]DAQ82909.1 MAG TPA: Terminase small subunit [Caudoviricetes sp.]HDS2233763.1 terminase small subunit [Klebsiella michiganensis]HBU6145350.1 terminase small subunit [Klebsiella oxytoca]
MATPDWEAIESAYWAGVLVLRDIGEQYGVTEGAIRKRAKKFGWVRKAGTQVRKSGTQKVESVNLRTKPKKPTQKIENQIDFTRQTNESTNDEWTLNPDEYGLTDMQARFVNEYLIDMDKTAAYKRAGYKSKGETAAAAARRLYRNVSVNQAILMLLGCLEMPGFLVMSITCVMSVKNSMRQSWTTLSGS